MKKIFILFLIFQFSFGFSQKNMKMYYENKTDTISYYADNSEIYPVSVVFSGQPELENLRKPEVFKITHVLPPKSVRTKVATFVVTDKKKKWGIKKMPSYFSYLGDVTLKSYDANYQYDLPFRKGKSFQVWQGYNGTFSHQNEYALDFVMPEGTDILAAREGLVIDEVHSNSKGCATESCAKFGNYVTILHSDGTVAQYYHLKLNGVSVKIGDEIKKGDLIGLSGNTGWSNGPHLHFVCFLPDAKNKKTIKTLFRTLDGTKSEFLAEKKTYSKNY